MDINTVKDLISAARSKWDLESKRHQLAVGMPVKIPESKFGDAVELEFYKVCKENYKELYEFLKEQGFDNPRVIFIYDTLANNMGVAIR